MKLLKVDTLAEAREKLLKSPFVQNIKTMKVQVAQSLACILAENITSPHAVPAFRRSTVDGYAVQSQDTMGATESIPSFLKILGEVDMGEVNQFRIDAGECVYVPTGGMLPQGADAMVMVEFCEPFSEDSLAVYRSVAPGNNLVEIGDDIQMGSPVFEKGRKIGAHEIGVLSSMGIGEVEVFQPFTISIFSTGDELIGTDEKLSPGKVYDINTPALEALCLEAGFRVLEKGVLPDERNVLEKAVAGAMETADIVLVSGGSSQGKKDMTAEILDAASAGGLMTHGLALKPGKPTITAYDRRTETLLFGLPGHPVAAVMIFRFLVLWLKDQYLGKEKERPLWAELTASIAGDSGKETVQLLYLEETEEGYLAHPIFSKSGLMTGLSKAEGYTLIGRNTEGIKKGDKVKVYLF